MPDWFETTGLTIPGTVPPDAITDTMYHMGYTAIGMIHPFYMLDVSEDARINGHQIGTGPNVAANSNIRFGKDALMNSSGTFNMAFGMNALKSMTSSLKNIIAIGYNSQTAYISGTGIKFIYRHEYPTSWNEYNRQYNNGTRIS